MNEHSLTDGILAITSSPEDIRTHRSTQRIIDSGVTTAVFSGAVYKSSAVADGRFVGYVEHKVNAYDIAAIDVIVTEAGGMVTSLSGAPHDYTAPLKGVIVSNGQIHQRLIELAQGDA